MCFIASLTVLCDNGDRGEAHESPVDGKSGPSEDLVLNAIYELRDALEEENEAEALESWIESMKTPGNLRVPKSSAVRQSGTHT